MLREILKILNASWLLSFWFWNQELQRHWSYRSDYQVNLLLKIWRLLWKRPSLLLCTRSYIAICKVAWFHSLKLDIQVKGATLLLLLSNGWVNRKGHCWGIPNSKPFAMFQTACVVDFAWF